MPRFRRATRFVLITAAVLLSYLLLHALELPRLPLAIGNALRAFLQSPPAEPAPAAAAPRESGPPPASDPTGLALRRSIAFRLGADMGFVSVLQHVTALHPRADLEAAGTPILARIHDDAAWLQVGPPVLLQGRTYDDQMRLAARTEADESGMAARFAAKDDARLRHLYLAGVQAGMAHFWIWTLGPTRIDAYAPHIEAHARAAGLAEKLWRPLTQPPGGGRADAQREYHARLARVIDALARH